MERADQLKNIKERFRAAMVLSGVGDALGYKNGDWEFCRSGTAIHEDLNCLGGVSKLEVDKNSWMVSDDTVMHLATAEALAEEKKLLGDREKLYLKIAEKYKECMNDMDGRAPGPTTMSACNILKPQIPGGYRIPFNKRGGGCGGAMRSMCIGLRYSKPEFLDDLVAVSIEAGRMTHHHPTGYLGSLASALFTSYAIQEKPLREWGAGLMKTLEDAKKYVIESKVDVEDNLNAWDYFTKKWEDYLEARGIADGKSDPKFPEQYGVKERDAYYKSVSFDGWGGASGHDAPMIAYDALLSCQNNWEELCSRSMFHGGDSDSTGVIAACCYGAMFGFKGVPRGNYEGLEYRERLEDMGDKLYSMQLKDALIKIGQEISFDEADPDTVQKIVDILPTVDSSNDLGASSDDYFEDKAEKSKDTNTQVQDIGENLPEPPSEIENS